MLIRLVEVSDAREILDIYSPYVTGTAVSFEFEAPALAEMERRIRDIKPNYPYLAAISEGKMVGYAYAGLHKRRAAYQWNAELSVYVARGHHGRGAGRTLYAALLELLAKQNIKNVYGVVSAPNPASEKLHEFFGFRVAGRYLKSGFKHGLWHDIIEFEKRLGDDGPPEAVVPFKLLAPALIEEILTGHNRRLSS